MRTTYTLGTVLAAVLSSGGVHAYVIGNYSSGLLVPLTIHQGPGDTTAVGLVTQGCDEPGDPTPGVTVYWTFFDVDSGHVTDGQIPMTDDDVYAFVWASEAGLGLEGKEGYLVFAADTDGNGALDGFDAACLAGEAFQVVAADADVAYKPVWPMNLLDFGLFGVPDLTRMDATSVTTLIEGAVDLPGPGGNETLLMRYSVGGGDTTDLVVWSAEAIGGPEVVFTVSIYDEAENRRSVNFALPHAEQNTIDPAAITGRPVGFVNGFIEWRTPDDGAGDYVDNGLADGNGLASYSVLHSAGFSARQTILNPHHP